MNKHEITWRDVFYADHKLWGFMHHAFDAADKAGYPYICWNTVVFHTKDRYALPILNKDLDNGPVLIERDTETLRILSPLVSLKLEFLGYTGSVEITDGKLHGRVSNIKDIVTYCPTLTASDYSYGAIWQDFQKQFHISLLDYLNHCVEKDLEPDAPGSYEYHVTS